MDCDHHKRFPARYKLTEAHAHCGGRGDVMVSIATGQRERKTENVKCSWTRGCEVSKTHSAVTPLCAYWGKRTESVAVAEKWLFAVRSWDVSSLSTLLWGAADSQRARNRRHTR